MQTEQEKMEKIIHAFDEQIRSVFKKDTVSVILFGSAASGEFRPKFSDFNFLVVVTPEGMDRLEQTRRWLRTWRKQNIDLPLFMTADYIRSSLDSFPVEFLNIKQAYRVVSGEDVLEKLRFKKEDIRLQCERDVKGKWLQLRQRAVLTRGKEKSVRRLIKESLTSFLSIFRALLFFKNQDVPPKSGDLVLKACREFGMDEGLFSLLLQIRTNRAHPPRKDWTRIMKNYIAEIEKLSETINHLG